MSKNKPKKSKSKNKPKKAPAKKTETKAEAKPASKPKKQEPKSDKRAQGTHPAHPKCPKCTKAMYKTMEKGKAVKKSDPWAFCRNKDCELYGKDQTQQTQPAPAETPATEGEQASEEGDAAAEQKQPEQQNQDTQDTSVAAPVDSVERKALESARTRITQAINKKGQYSHNICSLVLQQVHQEIGIKYANQLIDEFNLTKLFSIQKR